MADKMKDLIEVPPVRTVVRLEDATERPEDTCTSFVFTEEVTEHLHALTEAIRRGNGKGYFLRGEFGSGKSHFLAALSAWLEERPGSDHMTEQHEGLSKLRDEERSLLPVTVSLVDYRSGTGLEQIVIEAIETKLHEKGIEMDLSPMSRFLDVIRNVLEEESLRNEFAERAGVDPGQVPEWTRSHPRDASSIGIKLLKEEGVQSVNSLVEERRDTLSRALDAVREAGFDGTVLMLDELSEFLRSKPDASSLNEDARTLQLMGEVARDEPLWIIGAVQESLEQTGAIEQPTFRKIKDRYPVVLYLSRIHIRDLIRNRLVRLKPGASEVIRAVYEAYRDHFPGFQWESPHFHRIYPVHPRTLELLEGLSELFSRHRGIVDFVHAQIAGDPERNIPGILDRPPDELLAPDKIYEHFRERLAEYSELNQYPRTIVPHLDEVAETVLEDDEDVALARRLFRILVLYEIHQTAGPLTPTDLAELAACMLSPQDPELSGNFVSEVILDPVAAESGMLQKERPDSGDPLEATYHISGEQDHARTLGRRIDKKAEEIQASRRELLVETVRELDPSPAWPGRSLCEGLPSRNITWRRSQRAVIVGFLPFRNHHELFEQVETRIENGEADCAVLIGFPMDEETPLPPDTDLWLLSEPEGENAEEIVRYHAAKRVLQSMNEGNPVDEPLQPLAEKKVDELRNPAHQAALRTMYRGEFKNHPDLVEQSLREVKKFDRFIETGAAPLLENRFPRFQEIEPDGVFPSRRLYRRLLDDLIREGSLSLQKARDRGIAEAIEGLAVPLGLVNVQSAAYRVEPDPEGHPLLSELFSTLSNSEPTDLDVLCRSLRTGPFGVPEDTISFLLVSLAHVGHISIRRSGRRVPLEYLKLDTVEDADEVAPGELIDRSARKILTTDCSFLLPSGSWDSFGLRQQREAWKQARSFKENTKDRLDELGDLLEDVRGYAAFSSFDLDQLLRTCEKIDRVLDEIKVSYSPRKGLERFLKAWDQENVTQDDLQYVENAHAFFSESMDSFIFTSHYVGHRAVEKAAEHNEEIREHVREIEEIFDHPEASILPDGGDVLENRFQAFRDLYLEDYLSRHNRYYEGTEQEEELSAEAGRTLKLIERLSEISALDRPPEVNRLLEERSEEDERTCDRRTEEELLQSPVCGCGFMPGTETEEKEENERAPLPERLDEALEQYADVLCEDRVIEALRARAYAVSDMEPETAERLRSLADYLGTPEQVHGHGLLDRLDKSGCRELRIALEKNLETKNKHLRNLLKPLSGRRLTPDRIRSIFEQWLEGEPDDVILVLDEVDANGTETAGNVPGATAWWPLFHRLRNESSLDLSGSNRSQEVHDNLQQALETAYPVSDFSQAFDRMSADELVSFLLVEPAHTAAVQQAWRALVEKILRDGESATRAVRSANGKEERRPKHLDREVRSEIRTKLKHLRKLCETRSKDLPDKLRTRIELAKLAEDPWASERIRKDVQRSIQQLARESGVWLESLDPVPPIETDDHPLVLLLDGVPPDVWMYLEENLETGIAHPETQWHRLTETPETVTVLRVLFDIPENRDPVEVFQERKGEYVTVSGDEEVSLLDLIPAERTDGTLLVRVAIMDREAHSGARSLVNLASYLENTLRRQLPPLVEHCKAKNRRLVITTDHGMSYEEGSLTHGAGGVFEEAVFRLSIS